MGCLPLAATTPIDAGEGPLRSQATPSPGNASSWLNNSNLYNAGETPATNQRYTMTDKFWEALDAINTDARVGYGL
jgi:hypothetical protein